MASFLVSKLSKAFISSSAELTNFIFSTNQAFPLVAGFTKATGLPSSPVWIMYFTFNIFKTLTLFFAIW